jgi:hypothetical protein
VVVVTEIQLGEEHCTLEFVEELIDNRYGETIADNLAIEGAVIHAKRQNR